MLTFRVGGQMMGCEDLAATMDASFRERYEATRQLSGKPFRAFCYAPFVSMYLDQWGFVRACCQNWTGTLGNLAHERLDAIWNGPRAEALREAMRQDDLSLGCQYCHWQVQDGHPDVLFSRNFDWLPVTRRQNAYWPAQIEFAVTNACNLECIMCNGELSSRIRSAREGLPPLPKPYGEEFFVDLRKYLPHLRQAKFLGGEPFLAPEAFRIWEMMIEDGLQVECHVTTNGTQWNPRIQRVLELLPVSVSVSFDGATAETLERVRVRANYAEILQNFKRFHAYARRRGTYIGLTYCLMPQNWQEFGDFLQFADEWDCEVIVNTVLFPPECSVYHLDRERLSEIVHGLEAQSPQLESGLQRNRQRWLDEVARLRQRLAHVDEPLAFIPRRWMQRFPQQTPEALAAAGNSPAAAAAGQTLKLVLDPLDRVLQAHGSALESLKIVEADVLGRPLEEVYAVLRHRLGGIMELGEESVSPAAICFPLRFVNDRLKQTTTEIRVSPRYGLGGAIEGTQLVMDVPE